MRKLLITSFIATILLTGCISSNPPKPVNLPSGYVLPPMPDTEENSKTIAGIDSNNNGVRDDIEIWIHTEYQDKDTRQVMMQHARQIQRALLNVWTKKDTHISWDEMVKTMRCERKHFNNPHSILYTKVASRTHNTLERVKRFKETDRLAGGEVFFLIDFKGDPCENY